MIELQNAKNNNEGSSNRNHNLYDTNESSQRKPRLLSSAAHQRPSDTQIKNRRDENGNWLQSACSYNHTQSSPAGLTTSVPAEIHLREAHLLKTELSVISEIDRFDKFEAA